MEDELFAISCFISLFIFIYRASSKDKEEARAFCRYRGVNNFHISQVILSNRDVFVP